MATSQLLLSRSKATSTLLDTRNENRTLSHIEAKAFKLSPEQATRTQVSYDGKREGGLMPREDPKILWLQRAQLLLAARVQKNMHFYSYFPS